jgi:mRNA-degrading endonuclease YafQ of YafQ-DinJ toxin-antitoxin module
MWTIVEETNTRRVLDRLPDDVLEKYMAWCAIVRQLGPHRLRDVKSFHDEKLSGNMKHLRASRLTLHWRVLYRVHADTVTVFVERITPHDYRR